MTKMMFDLDEDSFDESKIEEIELNCPWTITVPSGASLDFMITKLRRSFQHPLWLTVNIYSIGSSAHPIILDIKRETFSFAKLFITLTIYKKYPEPHLTKHDIHTLRELMDNAEFHMGTHTGYYIQEIKKTVQNQSKRKSSLLVVPELKSYSWWCQHLFSTCSDASFCSIFTGGASVVVNFFFSGAFTFIASGASSFPFSTGGAGDVY